MNDKKVDKDSSTFSTQIKKKLWNCLPFFVSFSYLFSSLVSPPKPLELLFHAHSFLYIAHWCCSNARVNLNTQCVPSTCFHFYVYREGFTILSLYFLNSASIVQSKKLRSWKTKETLKNFNFQDDFFLSFFIHSFCCFILPHHKKVKNEKSQKVSSRFMCAMKGYEIFAEGARRVWRLHE